MGSVCSVRSVNSVAVLLVHCLVFLLTSACAAETPALDALKADARFKTFVEAIDKASMIDDVNKAAEVTVFAPTEDAFEKLPDRAALFADINRLKEFVKNHIVSGKKISFTELTTETECASLSGQKLKIDPAGKVNGASCNTQPITATNGLIYTLDAVLPQENRQAAASFAPDWLANAYNPLGFSNWMSNWLKEHSLQPTATSGQTASSAPETAATTINPPSTN
jgi:uncharacterized surface protein with fasciclin (FAS1) repeats